MLKATESSDSKQNGGSSVGGRLKQKLDKHYRYSREELLRISMCELSLQRPSYLSTEFDNENGKFQPDKWLEYRWVVEGTENRSNHNVRRKEKFKQEVLDGNSTVLSPQRRGFSSGCRAASPHKSDFESERLGASKGNWRSGAGFMLKNSNDFKPSFQKSGSGEVTFSRGRQVGSGERRSAGDSGFKLGFHKECQSQGRNRLVSNQGSEEKVPEWMEDGPTSMHDMIELKGFDDEKKNAKRTSGGKLKKDVSLKQHGQHKAGSGKSSVGNRLEASMTQSSSDKLSNVARDVANSQSSGSTSSSQNGDKFESSSTVSFQQMDALHSVESENLLHDKVVESSHVPSTILSNKLPNSDAEFAAIMGLLDASDFDPLKEPSTVSSSSVVTCDPAPCSRLSRFFSTANKTDTVSGQQTVAPGDSNNNEGAAARQSGTTSSSNSILQKIFASSHSLSPMHLETSVPTSLPGVVHAEDLEKGFHWEATRGMVPPPSTSSDNEHLRQLVLNPQMLTTSQHQQLASYLVSKGNPLGDPHQQAQLMTKLNRFALQQVLSSGGDVSARTAPVPVSMLPHSSTLSGLTLSNNSGEMSQYKVPSQDPAILAQPVRPNVDVALLKTMPIANQRFAAVAHPSQQTDIAVRNMLANLMVSSNVSHGTGGCANVLPSTSSTHSRTSTTTVPSAFMPTSVMRQMTKNNVSVEDKTRRSGTGTLGNTGVDEKRRGVMEDHQQKQVDYAHTAAGNVSGSNADVMSKLLQQQYVPAYSMRPSMERNSWSVSPNLYPQWRAQAVANQAEQQRLHALAWMQKNFDQTQVAATLGIGGMQNVMGSQLGAFDSGGVAQFPSVPVTNVHKYQSPLEKLLQSAGVPTKQAGHASLRDGSAGDTHGVPSIISRLPPQANCISVEELEKQYASN